MNLINKTCKQALFFLMLFAFLTQQAIANDDKAEASNEYNVYKINKSPIVNFWKLINYLPDYTKLHLDYFADECKQALIIKSPFLLTLMTNSIASAYLV